MGVRAAAHSLVRETKHSHAVHSMRPSQMVLAETEPSAKGLSWNPYFTLNQRFH